jgi:putative lipoic acid-binding regulatory protein
MNQPRAPSLIEYPCAFPIKIMGANVDGFAAAVVAVVQRHAPDFDPSTLEMRASSSARFLSCTATIRATSRPQLDALYIELSAHPLVSVVL